MDDNPDLVRSLVRLVANKKIKLCESGLRPDCDIYRVEKVNCRDGKDFDVLPHVGMKITWRNGAKEARFVKGVSAKNTVTYEYESQLLSRSYPNDFISALYSCKYQDLQTLTFSSRGQTPLALKLNNCHLRKEFIPTLDILVFSKLTYMY